MWGERGEGERGEKWSERERDGERKRERGSEGERGEREMIEERRERG